MKKIRIFSGILLLSVFHLSNTSAQDVYSIFSGEMLFQSGTFEVSGEPVNSNMRFSMWFHAGQYVHIDLGDNIGFYSGGAMRNIGFIRDDDSVKIKYRSYTLGVPIALKLGSFSNDFYIFGGAEYEWLFHFKQKTFINDEKTKYKSWFSKRTPSFLPSVFAGIHFPKGFHLTFKYYLDDFLNHNYKGSDAYSDYTTYTNTQLWYISLSWHVRDLQVSPPSGKVNLTAITR